MFSARRESPRTLTLQRRVSMTTYIKPTVLYIKQHSITGLKYFGKTTTKDTLKYPGSGVHWTRHIKKHGKQHVTTIWVSEPYIDSDAIVEFALSFSKEHNIVESEDWANIIPENGLDGGVAGIPRSAETKQKISDTKKGKPNVKKGKPNGRKGETHSAEHNQKISDALQGKPCSDYRKQKISDAKKGIPQAKITCPHCGLSGGVSGMTRWHFDNCKKRSTHIANQVAETQFLCFICVQPHIVCG